MSRMSNLFPVELIFKNLSLLKIFNRTKMDESSENWYSELFPKRPNLSQFPTCPVFGSLSVSVFHFDNQRSPLRLFCV